MSLSHQTYKLNYTHILYFFLQTYTLLCKSDKERADWKENMLCHIKSSTGKTAIIVTLLDMLIT